MNEMIERVARAILADREACSWDDLPKGRSEKRLCLDAKGNFRSINENSQEDYLSEARAAIAAMREPTEAMCSAGDLNSNESQYAMFIWPAMIDEALKE